MTQIRNGRLSINMAVEQPLPTNEPRKCKQFARGTEIILTQRFEEDEGGPAIQPCDPTMYPSVTLYDRNETVVGSGRAVAVSDRDYEFKYFLPKDFTLGEVRAEWFMISASNRQISREELFLVVDTIVSEPEERTYFFMTAQNTCQRVFIKNLEPYSEYQAVLLGPGNAVLKTYPQSEINTTYDGQHVYWFDTPVFVGLGNYQVTWTLRTDLVAAQETVVQQIRIPANYFWTLLPSFRLLIDKVQKSEGQIQGYTDAMLFDFMERGVGLLNGYKPATSWSLFNAPQNVGVTEYILLAALWWGLNAQYLAEVELAFQFTGQAVTLDYDHTSGYADAMGRINDYLNDKFGPYKEDLYRKCSRVASVGVRGHHFSRQSSVFRIDTVNTGSSINRALGVIGIS